MLYIFWPSNLLTAKFFHDILNAKLLGYYSQGCFVPVYGATDPVDNEAVIASVWCCQSSLPWSIAKQTPYRIALRWKFSEFSPGHPTFGGNDTFKAPTGAHQAAESVLHTKHSAVNTHLSHQSAVDGRISPWHLGQTFKITEANSCFSKPVKRWINYARFLFIVLSSVHLIRP